MRASMSFVGWGALVVGALAGCGSDVVTEGAGGAGGAGGGSGGVGGTLSCGGEAPTCALSCGSDALVDAVCTDSGLVCPEGSVDINDCPAGTCVGKPPPCTECQAGAFVCKPELCADECPEVMCASCPPGTESFMSPTCACKCTDKNQLVCQKKPAATCCISDIECGDAIYVPCVNGVCKFPEADGSCWSDSQCQPGTTCAGAFVCPCGEKCDTADKTGVCSAP